MKLKSKLIATIVSMCAAVAVMGVGVWASTSQSFTVTVQNDIDIKIVNVNADVYGEYAIYSNTGDAPIERTTAEQTRTLLYSRSAYNGYNDGNVNKEFTTGDHDEKTVGGQWEFKDDAPAGLATSGLGLYIANANNQALDSGYTGSNNIDTAHQVGGTGSSATGGNVDYKTHYAQMAYMYTVYHYGTDGGAANDIYLTVENLSKTFAGVNGGTAVDTTMRSDYYLYYNSAWKVIEAGKTYTIPAEVDDSEWAVLCLYTFERANENMDWSGLTDQVGHSITMTPEAPADSTPGELATMTGTTMQLKGVTFVPATISARATSTYNATTAATQFVELEDSKTTYTEGDYAFAVKAGNWSNQWNKATSTWTD